MNIKQKILSETFWAFVAKGTAAIGGLFFVIFIPKLGSIEVYGQLSLCLAYVAIFSMLSGTQINSAVKNEITKYKLENSASKEFFYEGLKLKAILFVSLALVFVGVIQYLHADFLSQNMFLILTLLLTMNTWGLVISVFESIHELFFEALLYIIEYSVTVGLILHFHFIDKLTITNLIYSFIWGYALTLGLGATILFVKFREFKDIKLFTWRPAAHKTLLKRTAFLTLTGISVILLAKVDSILISFFLDIKEVGYFTIASDITKNTVLLSMPVMLGALPTFFGQDEKKFVYKNLFILLGINLFIFIGLFLFGKDIIQRIYGLEYSTAGTIVKYLSLYPLFASLQTFVQEILILQDKTKQIFFFGIIGIAIDIIGNILLIPLFGLQGAAFATTFSYLVWFLISFFYIYRHLNVTKITSSSNP